MAQSDTRQQYDEASLAQWWSQFNQRSDQGQTQKIHIFVRSVSPTPGLHAHRKQLMDNIEEAHTREWVDEYELSVLGEDICLCDACESMRAANNVSDMVEQLRTWRTGGMKACGFTERVVANSITDETYRTVTPPDITVGVFSENSLAGVFPCRVEGTVYCPEAFVRDLHTEHTTPQRERRTLSAVRR